MNETQTPDYLGHRQRLRSRFLKSDGRDMADYELLELVLTYSIVRKDVKPIAKALIKNFGTFAEVINAPYDELVAFNGISENTVLLKMINSASLRASWQKLLGEDAPILNNIDNLVDYCRASMCYQDVEELRIIYLNSKLRIICEKTLQKGTLSYAVFKQYFPISLPSGNFAGILPSASQCSAEKRLPANHESRILCLGRAGLCLSDAGLHCRQLSLRLAGGHGQGQQKALAGSLCCLQPGHSVLVQVYQLPAGQSQRPSGNHPSPDCPRTAHRHFLLHLPGHELRH